LRIEAEHNESSHQVRHLKGLFVLFYLSAPRPIPTAGVGSLVQLCKPAHVEFVMPHEITSTEGEGVEA